MTPEVARLLAGETRGQPTGRALFYLASPIPFAMMFVVPGLTGEGGGGEVGVVLAVLLGLVGLCMVTSGLVRRQGGHTIACVVAATLIAVAPLALVLGVLSMGRSALFP